MERHPKQTHMRMSEEEILRAKELAAALGMTLSGLVRVLLQLPVEGVTDASPLIVVDCTTAVKLAREMRRWGHHYNQACHALNAIAYYLRATEMDTLDVMEGLLHAASKLEAMQPGIDDLKRKTASIAEGTLAFLGR